MPKSKLPAYVRSVDRRVLRFVREKKVFNAGEHVLAGVSGGADSTALLHVLAHLRAELDLQLSVAHFNHRLRSQQEAGEDERFVAAQAQTLGISIVTGAGDVRAAAAKESTSVEDAARRLRYRFYARCAAALGASVVSTGHTADDQAETVLLHVLRGSGLAGLRGMAARAPWPFGAGPQLARPLLQLGREDTERYCREIGVTPRQDPTNLLLDATRNRVRQELLPLLRQYNPRIREALARLSQAAALDASYLDDHAAGLYRELATQQERTVTFRRVDLQALAPALQLRILQYAVARLTPAPPPVEAVHLEAALAALGRRRGAVSLPGQVELTVTPGSVVMRHGPRPAVQDIAETPLTVPGITDLPGWTIEAELAPAAPGEIADHGPLDVIVDADALGPTPYVRSRRPGDRLRPLGLRGQKKLQDILVDAGVPLEERDGLPLVCGAGGILWVTGVRIAQDAAITTRTVAAVRLKACRK